MLGMNYLAVVVTAVAAIATSSVWYIVFGKARIELLGKEPGASVDTTKPQPARMAVEIVRTLVVTCVLAHFVVLLGITGWISAVKLGLWLWIGFPFMILVGSVLWDKVPWKLAAIHAGDWLVKLLVMAIILGAWR
ncbi:MAG: DUF1761 domain-containing protein [Acidobacteria bacterium]|nr:MAG: DUF1761 domain-containing protein [Acidobacteriota bacterium]